MRGASRWFARPGVLATVLLLPAAVVMLGRIGEPLGGSHVFRQAHVAANIDKFVQRGLSLRPATWNQDVPFAAFDFPLFQLAVAEVCRLSGAAPLKAARATNLLLLLGTLVVLDRLLVEARVRRWPRVATLALFAYSPLSLFYFDAPMVDTLALALSLLALWQYLRLQPPPRGSLALMAGAAFLGTLVKNPVFVPAFVAVLWHRIRSSGPRGLVRRDGAVFFVAAGLGVASFKAYWMLVNGESGLLTPWEQRIYFGPLAERLSLVAWRPVISDLLWRTASPPLAALALIGALGFGRRRGAAAPVFTGLAAGCAVLLLVFFDRFPPHNYYQLPFVFPLAFFAAEGVERLRVLARWQRRSRPALAGATRALIATVVVATGVWNGFGFLGLAASDPGTLAHRSQGEWIHDHTGPDDYVIYVVEGSADDWNPAFLYFAQRDGFDLPLRELNAERLDALARRAREHARRVLVFTRHGEGADVLAGLNARLLAAMAHRALFELTDSQAAKRGAAGAGPPTG